MKLSYFAKEFLSEKRQCIIRRQISENKRKDEIKLVSDNDNFKNLHLGERCFIIGNGPSIKTVDFHLLQNEITFTVNQLSRLERFSQLKTNYHLWSDERFFHLNKDDEGDMELLETMLKVKTGDNSPVVFYKTTAKEMIDSFDLNHMLKIEYYMDGPMGNHCSNIEYPLTRMMPIFSTCIHYAIVIAVYMGFKEIYLLGCDCTGIINTINSRISDSNHFEYAYEITDNEKKRMRKVSTESSIADEFMWYGNLLSTYGVLYDYARNHGCNLYNATVGSIIENVPRVNLDDVLKQEKVD